jgi:hypothetical protein
VDQQKAATPQIAGLRQGDRQREADRHGRIGGVPALLEDSQPDLAGQDFLGDHQALASMDRLEEGTGAGERAFGVPHAGSQQE